MSEFYKYIPMGPPDNPLPRLSPIHTSSWAKEAGFLLISADGSDPTVYGYTEGGSTTVSGDFDLVELVQVEDLSLAQLNQAVTILDITTSASTKAGLISAINNHLNGNP